MCLCMNLKVRVACNFNCLKAKFHYASWFEACRRQVRSQIPLHYLVRTCFEPASNQFRTSSEPASVMEFGFNVFTGPWASANYDIVLPPNATTRNFLLRFPILKHSSMLKQKNKDFKNVLAAKSFKIFLGVLHVKTKIF